MNQGTPTVFHRGIAAPLLQPNIDTDAIIPSREFRRVSKQGLGEALFAGWRYRSADGREPVDDFVLNQPQYRGASILLAGNNFGCGSSREYAVWALKDFGIKVILAPSFGSIFFNNCGLNGLLLITVDAGVIGALAEWVSQDPQRNQLTIDLHGQRIHWQEDKALSFAVEPGQRRLLLEGLDHIGATLRLDAAISAFETADRQRRPWVHQLPEQ